jgi:hypothetical protein
MDVMSACRTGVLLLIGTRKPLRASACHCARATRGRSPNTECRVLKNESRRLSNDLRHWRNVSFAFIDRPISKSCCPDNRRDVVCGHNCIGVVWDIDVESCMHLFIASNRQLQQSDDDRYDWELRNIRSKSRWSFFDPPLLQTNHGPTSWHSPGPCSLTSCRSCAPYHTRTS